MDSIENLMDFYKIFNSDSAYYNRLISTYSRDINKIEAHIKADIKKSWSNYDIEWFICYANEHSFNEVISLMDNYELEINPVILQNLVNRCPMIAQQLDSLLSKREIWTEDDIEKDFSSGKLFDIIYNYAIINNRLDVGDTIKKYAQVVSYDGNLSDSTRLYIREIQSLQDFEKNHERIVSYKEYKKLSKVTKDPEMAKKYEEKAKRLRKLIIESNLCLTIPIASKFRGRDVDILDLIQEGSIGLMTALEKFNPEKSYSFSTYATWWIRQAINRCIADTSRPVRIPVHQHERHAQIKGFIDDFVKLYSREPSPLEISKALSIPEDKVDFIKKSFEPPISLDQPVKNDSNEDSSEMYEFVADEVDYDEKLFAEEFTKKFLSELKPKEEFVIRMLFGISDGKDPRFEEPHTLDAVGKEINVTRERVRQIRDKLINKKRKKEGIVVEEPVNKKHKSFWEQLEGFDRGTIMSKLKYLSDEDIETLKAKYGETFDDFISTDINQNNKIMSVINKIKKMLNNPNYRPIYSNNYLTTLKEGLLSEFVNMSIEEIVHKLGESSPSLKILRIVFGKNLDGIVNISVLNDKEKEIVMNIINGLNTRDIVINGKTIFEIFDFTMEEILAALDSVNPKYKELTIKLFGENLDKCADFYLLNSEEYQDWLKLINVLKRNVAKIRNSKSHFSIDKLAGLINRTTSEFQEILDNMDKSSKIYGILMKRMNQETLSYTEKNIFDRWCADLKNSKNTKKYNTNNSYLLIILSNLNITESELMLIYYTLDQSTKIYDILTKIIDGILISDEEVIILKTWINMKQRNKSSINITELPDTDQTQLLLKDINCSSKELLNFLSNLPFSSKKYLAIGKFISNVALDSKESSNLYNAKSQMRRVYQKNPEIKSEVVLSFDGLSKDMQRLIELRIGLYDGTIYSISEISRMLNIPESTINEYLSTAIDIIKKDSIDKGMKLKLIKS